MSLQSLEIFDYFFWGVVTGQDSASETLHPTATGFDSPTSQQPGKHALGWHGGTRARLLSSFLF